MWGIAGRFRSMAVLAAGMALSAHAGELNPEAMVQPGTFVPKGQWREATVPDTLDLAERAEMALNYMVHNVEPDQGYSLYHIFRFDGAPPKAFQLTWNLPVKMLRTYPWVRTMTGSELGLDVEAGTMLAYLRQVDEDGVLRYPFGGEGVPQGTAYAYTSGMLAIALENWYLRDGNPGGLKWISKLGQGLDKMAIRVENRAYYPLESGYQKDGAWHWTTRSGATPFMPYTPPEEPEFEQQGYEGIAKYDQSAPLRALVKDYTLNDRRESMDLAARLVRFMMKPGMWKDTDAEGYAGNERGAWEGHFHGNLTALHGLMEYAVARDDPQLKHLVRGGYDHTLKHTTRGMGWSPFWIPPAGFNRPAYLSGWCDTCNVADTIVLAVKLTDAGIGDYWDDVESLVRNQLAEQQITDLELMRELAGADPNNDELLKRFQGGFGGLEPTRAKPLVYGCCSANGPMGLYYAWHGITRCDHGVATVNMFLNRTAKWMDIDSHLPYAGRLELHNKTAHTALVRIPNWVAPDTLHCYVNKTPIEPGRSGNYLVFTSLAKGDRIELEFPVKEFREKTTIYGTQYTLHFRGNTLVDIAPRDAPPISQDIERYKKMYPVYSREHLKATKTPMRTVKRFAADHIIPPQ